MNKKHNFREGELTDGQEEYNDEYSHCKTQADLDEAQRDFDKQRKQFIEDKRVYEKDLKELKEKLGRLYCNQEELKKEVSTFEKQELRQKTHEDFIKNMFVLLNKLNECIQLSISPPETLQIVDKVIEIYKIIKAEESNTFVSKSVLSEASEQKHIEQEMLK